MTFDRIECNFDLLPDKVNFTKGSPLALVSDPSAQTPADLILMTLIRPHNGKARKNVRKRGVTLHNEHSRRLTSGAFRHCDESQVVSYRRSAIPAQMRFHHAKRPGAAQEAVQAGEDAAKRKARNVDMMVKFQGIHHPSPS